jgi:hypothetical protein
VVRFIFKWRPEKKRVKRIECSLGHNSEVVETKSVGFISTSKRDSQKRLESMKVHTAAQHHGGHPEDHVIVTHTNSPARSKKCKRLCTHQKKNIHGHNIGNG